MGRFTSVDPQSQYASPYVGMGNNPVNMVDPDGEFAHLIVGAALGGGAGYLFGLSQGYEGRQMFNSIAGGALLGVGVAAGIETGFFSKVGQGVGNVASQVPGAATNLAQRVFSGAGPTVGMDVATKTASSIIAGPFTQPGLLVDDYGLSHLDYGASYQPSRYAGMNIMQYHQAKTSSNFWNDPVTQVMIDLATLPLPVPKLGMTRILGRIGGRAIFEGASSRILNTTLRQLQAKFKHASDFGVTSNWNKAAAGRFNSAINQHINSSGVRAINGTYHGQPATHYLNPETGLNVISRSNGQFWSGWKLSPEQLRNVLEHGGL